MGRFQPPEPSTVWLSDLVEAMDEVASSAAKPSAIDRKGVGQSARVASHAGAHVGRKPSSARQTIVEGIRLFTWRPIRYVTHDCENLLNNIAAGTVCSTSQQILNCSAEFCFGLGLAHEIPINLI